jgi:uncharacterized OB-fold protein
MRAEDIYPKVFDVRIDTRFGILKDTPQVINNLLEKYNIQANDISKFAVYAPDARSPKALAGSLGLDLKTQMQESLFRDIGITGTAHCLLLLIAAFEGAKPDKRIVCASYGEGSDAILIRTTDKLEEEKAKHRGTKYMLSKKTLPSYGRFLSFKKEIEIGWPEWERSSVAKYWRDEDWILPLRGMKCNNCGTLQYPVRSICSICNEKDNYEKVKLSKKGKVFTYTHDYLLGPGNTPADGVNPATRLLIELDDGCRTWLEMTDHDIEEVDVDMPVELTFRLLHQKSDFNFYGWRARPPR